MTKLIDVYVHSDVATLDKTLASIPEWMEVHILSSESIYEFHNTSIDMGTCLYQTFMDPNSFYLPGIERVKSIIEDGSHEAFFTDSNRVMEFTRSGVTNRVVSRMMRGGVVPHKPLFVSRSLHKFVLDCIEPLMDRSVYHKDCLDFVVLHELTYHGSIEFLDCLSYEWIYPGSSISSTWHPDKHKAFLDIRKHYNSLPSKCPEIQTIK